MIDNAVPDPNAKLGDFVDGTNSTDDYDYDGNGNLKLDLNKGITSITYYHTNRPSIATFGTKGYVGFLTDAEGTKIRKNTVENKPGGNRGVRPRRLGDRGLREFPRLEHLLIGLRRNGRLCV